jgi:hypothetical protein
MRAAIALIAVVLLTACHSSQAPVAPGSPSPAQLGALPAPATLTLRDTPPRTAADSAASTPLEQRGGDYLTDPLNRVTALGTAGEFDPDFGVLPSISDLAYAVYQFDVTGYAGDPTITPVWIDAPDADTCFLALANWDTNAWDWYALADATDTLTLPSLAAYSDAGKLLAAAVCIGTARSNLGLLRIGDGSTGPRWRMTQLSAANVDVAHVKLFELQGRPAVVYHRLNTAPDPDTSQIVLKRALDDAGETWSDVQVIWNVPTETPYNGGVQFVHPLIIDNRLNVVVAARGDDSEFIMRVHYLHANDDAATSFAAPTQAHEAHDAYGVHDAHLMGNGLAAFMDLDLFFGEYRLRRANDAAGASWGQTNIDPEVEFTSKTPYGLLTANGNLAALYPYQSAPGPNGFEIRFRRTSMPDASAWEPAVTALPAPGGNAQAWEVTLTGDRPAFLYSTGPGAFAFTAALNIQGSSWPPVGVPVTDLDNIVRMSVEQIGGVPALGYTRNDPDTLYYRPATNPFGLTWDTPQEVHVGAYATDPSMFEFTAGPAMAGAWSVDGGTYPVFHIYR